MSNFSITLVQPDMIWENPGANLQHLSELVQNISDTDLIVLPEMFTTGFSMNSENIYEKKRGIGFKWMQELAEEKNCAVCGSLIVREQDNYFNRLYFVQPGGKYHQYDKKHLFTYAGEHKVYTGGNERLTLDFRGLRLSCYICYDLRFPVWCRNRERAHLMLFVANWPERREEAWASLLKARAIENMCYVAGVNRVGKDGNGISYSGGSVLYNELGKEISGISGSGEKVVTSVISTGDIMQSRERFSFLEDADEFTLL